jgi:hypothetical protein
MTALGIQALLERQFDIYLTPQEIRNVTFANLDELSAANQFTVVDK